MIDVKHPTHEKWAGSSAKRTDCKEISQKFSIRCETKITTDQIRQEVSVGSESRSQQHRSEAKCDPRLHHSYCSDAQTGECEHYRRNSCSRKAIEAHANQEVTDDSGDAEQ